MPGPRPPSSRIDAADELRDAAREVESEIEELGDPEAAPPLPSSSLAAHAASAPIESLATGRRGTSSEILQLAWPVMLSQVLVSISGLLDRAMIGRVGGELGAAVPLAAAGFATQFFFLIQSTLFAVSLACVALSARAIGSGDAHRSRLVVAASVQVALAVTAVLMALMLGFAEPAMSLLGAEPVVVSTALPYLQLVIGSALMLAVSLIIDSALRANKDTRTPMYIAGVVTVIKLALNWALIFGNWGAPRLELVGAGIATVISQAIGLLLFVWAMARAPKTSPVRLHWRDLVRANPLRRDVVRISLPGIAERLVMNGAMLSYFWVLGRGYGTLAVAAYTVGIALLSFSWIPGQGYAQAGATLIGHALGARQPELATRTGWLSAALALGTAVILGVVCVVAAEPLARLFTDDVAVIEVLIPFLLTLAVAQPFLQLHFTLGGAHRGAGDTVTPLVAATIGTWLFRVPLSLLFAFVLEAPLIWVWGAIIVDHMARSAYLAWSFRRGRWRDAAGLGGGGH